MQTYSKESLTKGKGSILVCCGPGKNGGMGLVCARHLKSFGYRPTVFYAKPSTGQATYANLATQCEKADIPSLLYLPSDAQLVADSYSLVVDAIFGVGYNPPMGSNLAAIVQTISRSKVPVVSIDVPSGWIVDDEAQSDDAVRLQQPDMLISVMAPARCSRQFTGRSHLLIGRYLPNDLAKKYELCLPEFFGTDVFVELKPASSEHHQDGSAKAKKEGSLSEDGPGSTKSKDGGDEV